MIGKNKKTGKGVFRSGLKEKIKGQIDRARSSTGTESLPSTSYKIRVT